MGWSVEIKKKVNKSMMKINLEKVKSIIINIKIESVKNYKTVVDY